MSAEHGVQELLAFHGAVGWLLSAIEKEHPGFLAGEAAKAEGTDYAPVLRGWADDAAKKATR